MFFKFWLIRLPFDWFDQLNFNSSIAFDEIWLIWQSNFSIDYPWFICFPRTQKTGWEGQAMCNKAIQSFREINKIRFLIQYSTSFTSTLCIYIYLVSLRVSFQILIFVLLLLWWVCVSLTVLLCVSLWHRESESTRARVFS